jgi:hypothetical protein
MAKYTNPELTDMVLIYGEALSNADATRRLYVGIVTLFIFPDGEISQNNDLTDFWSRCTGDCSRVQPKCRGGW